MEVNKNYKFTINVSSEGYEKKTDATCCLSSKGAEAINRKKMCFFEQTVTVDEFLSKAKNGHSFCALYRFEPNKKYWYTNKNGQKYLGYPFYQRDSKTATKDGLKIDFKRDEYFTGSQVIFIDIDLTKFTDVNEYINTLTFKPTMVYMSYSDNKEKHGVISRRFHLCYVFNELLDKDNFKICSSILSETLVKDTNEELDDKCGEKMSQYMNGCFGNNENYSTYSIYTYKELSEYKKYIEEYKEEVEENIEEDVSTTYYNELQKDQIVSEEAIEPEKPLFDERLLNDMCRLDYDEFMKYNRHKYNYFYRAEKDEWVNGLYQFVDDDYFSFTYSYGKNAILHDGQKRRKTVFMRMCLRRLMNPTADANTILFNAYEDIHRFFDFSGIDLEDYLRRNIINCFKKSLEEIKDDYSNVIGKLKETTRPKRGIIYKNRKAHTTETTFSILDEYYNINLSVSENLDIINNDYGFIVSERTIYSYISDRGLKSDKNKLTDDDIRLLTDVTKTCIENYNNIKSLGYKIGDKRYRRIYKEYKKKLEEEDKSTTYYNTLQKDQINTDDTINEKFNTDIYTEPIITNIYSSIFLINSTSVKPSINKQCLEYLPNGNKCNWDII